MKFWNLVPAVAGLVLSNSVNAAIIHDEAIDGDLSNDPFNPTEISLINGTNTIIGSIGYFTITDREAIHEGHDAFTFTLKPGQSLNSITLDTFIINGSNEYSGFAIYLGDYTSARSDPILVSAFNPALVGGDLMQSISTIEYGTYTVAMREFNEPNQMYQFTMNVSAVPIPAAMWLFASGWIGLVGFARRRKA